MNRLLDKKVNGKYPFAYRSAAATDLAETFRRIRRQMSAAPQVVAQTVRASGKSAVAEDTEGRGFESRPSAVAAPNVRALKRAAR